MLCDCERTAADDSPDTSAVFARLAGLGEGPERDLLCEEAVKAWLPMAHRIAGRFRDKGESLEDLKQIAAMGLVKAVNNYDPQRGPFEPYAVPTIRGELRRRLPRPHLGRTRPATGPGPAQQGATRPPRP